MRHGSQRAGLVVAATCAAATAGAYPEGAPWGAANPDADETCASCHYDYEPRTDSAALEIDGLPGVAVAGRRYALTIHLKGDAAMTAGFQLIVIAEGDAGRLSSKDASIETAGPAARSTRAVPGVGGASWAVEWQAPRPCAAGVTFLLAASAANDDQSPFGDQVHYRRWNVDVENDDCA